MNAVLRKYIHDVGDRVTGGLSELGSREGQMMVLHHSGDLKVFHGNRAIVFGVLPGYLKVEVPALTANLQMGLRGTLGSLTASMRRLLTRFTTGASFASLSSMRRSSSAEGVWTCLAPPDMILPR